MTNIIVLACGMAVGSIFSQLLVHDNVDFARTVFVVIFSFFILLVFQIIKKKVTVKFWKEMSAVAFGIAVGSFLYQLLVHDNVDFTRAAFVGFFSFLVLLIFHAIKKKIAVKS